MKNRICRGASAAAGLALLFSAAAATAQQCPPAEKLAVAIESTFNKKVEVKEVRPAPVTGLCEAVVSLQGRRSVLYSDTAGRYIVAGQIIDVEQRRDLTKETVAEYNRLSPEEMKTLASLTALTVGTTGPEVYFVTDPD